tara:strand:+ start:256 stop:462 length:207 start_codon:yes stop_codon:yes gene_type:complete
MGSYKKYDFYHVFTDRLDNFPNTILKAIEIMESWKKRGYRNLRIHGQTELEGGSFESDYIYGEGDYPN